MKYKFKFLKWDNFSEDALLEKIKQLDKDASIKVSLSDDDPFESTLEVDSKILKIEQLNSILTSFTKVFVNYEPFV